MHPAAQREKDWKDEWNYLYNERLGMVCEGRAPTDREMQLAKMEADRIIAELKRAAN